MLDKNKKIAKPEFIAVETTQVWCDKLIKLAEGEAVPAELDAKFIESLININLIKEKE